MGAALNVLVVANPVAGPGGALARAERLAQLLERRGHAVELFVTDGPEAARRRLAAPDAGLDALQRIVVVGGDGSLNDVVNALPDPGRLPLAELPVGTGNMLARELRLPGTPEGVAALVEHGVVRRVDLARADGRRFVMNASAGFDAMVTRALAERRTGSVGYPGYLRPILRVLRSYREPRLEVRIDGRETLPAALVVVSSVRNYGGIFTVAERARCDSGHLDVVCFERARIHDLARYAASALLGRVSRLRGVAYREAQRVHIGGPEPVPFQLDGDFRGTTPLEIEVQPGVLPVLVPRPGLPDQSAGRPPRIRARSAAISSGAWSRPR